MADGGIGKCKGRRSQHNKSVGKYIKQWVRTFANKERAWKRHLATHPHDAEVIQAARLRRMQLSTSAR
jgi:hypothetical protein